MNDCCPSDIPIAKPRPDYLLWCSGITVVIGYLLFWLVAAVVFVGLLERVPRELVMSALGQGGTAKGILRATLAGVALDLCSHGILMVGVKLYERGASIGQLMAFLIASPWNSLSLTIIMISLIGWQWTLLFIALSMVIGMISGILFDGLVARGKLPPNPHKVEILTSEQQPLWSGIIGLIKTAEYRPRTLGRLLIDGIRDSRMVFRWLLFGIVLAVLIRAAVPLDLYQNYFGPTVAGLMLTLLAATIIEVCSEGSTPIAADLLTRAAAPGNGFTFLMAGVATDYTEIMVLKDVTKSWKIALFMPLITLPQVLLIGWILNVASIG